MFNKLKKHLSRKFQIDKFHKYRKFIETMNKDYFQWQLGIIWEVLFNRRLRKEYYTLLETVLQREVVIRIDKNA